MMMNHTIFFTKNNKTHSKCVEKGEWKKKKLILSSLFNNYTHSNNNRTMMQMPYFLPPSTKTNMDSKIMPVLTKRTLLWLGKEYDINSLYPWTQQQLKMINLTLHTQKHHPVYKTLSYHTHTNNSMWTLHTHTSEYEHYKLSFHTKSNNNNTKQQFNLKHMTNNFNIKNTMNNLYGKWAMQMTKKDGKKSTQDNNLKHMSIMEHSKLKLKTNKHNSKKAMDTTHTHSKESKKKLKKKTGYQKNELLNTYSLFKDNFKICNIMHNKSNSNKMHIQQQSKFKY